MNFYMSFDRMVEIKSANCLQDAENVIYHHMQECGFWVSRVICRAIAVEIHKGNYCPTVDTIKITIPMKG